MRKTGGSRRLARIVGVGALVGSIALTLGSFGSSASADEPATEPTPSSATSPTPSDETSPGSPSLTSEGSQPSGEATTNDVTTQACSPPTCWPNDVSPRGPGLPVTVETDFARPHGKYMRAKDFSQLDDLQRLVKGSYWDPRTGKLRTEADRTSNFVYISISRMENSHRVWGELIRAAQHGVKVRVIHGKASQSKESRALQKGINAATYRGRHTGAFHICEKGKSLACLSNINGAIMHSKILLIGRTFTRNNKPVIGAFWSGSANLGGPSGEYTFNNGWTVYNDTKMFTQMIAMWNDMWAERDVNNDYLKYIDKHQTRYGYEQASEQGYRWDYAGLGMFYSNLANVTVYATPIYATPTNGKDPVLNALNRVVPDNTCRIRLQENRFKYRRIAVAYKLAQLANDGCTVEAVSFWDDLAVNRRAHCQLYIRICQPILDVFRAAKVRMPAGWAKPHDKTILIEAVMKANPLNSEELQPNGRVFPAKGVPLKFVQAGSAALTGSNLIVSDEITTESTDPQVYADYLEHWSAIKDASNGGLYRQYAY